MQPAVGDPALAGGWTRCPTEVPSNPYHSVILRFCDPICCWMYHLYMLFPDMFSLSIRKLYVCSINYEFSFPSHPITKLFQNIPVGLNLASKADADKTYLLVHFQILTIPSLGVKLPFRNLHCLIYTASSAFCGGHSSIFHL